MNENNDLKILNEMYKNVKMGTETYSEVSEKVGDQKFKDELSYQYNEYRKVLEKLNGIYEEFNEIPEDAPLTDKSMAWFGIQMNTMKDKSNSHISDMIIKGATMGITDSVKILNSNQGMEENIKCIIKDYVKMQQNNIERLKEFL